MYYILIWYSILLCIQNRMAMNERLFALIFDYLRLFWLAFICHLAVILWSICWYVLLTARSLVANENKVTCYWRCVLLTDSNISSTWRYVFLTDCISSPSDGYVLLTEFILRLSDGSYAWRYVPLMKATFFWRSVPMTETSFTSSWRCVLVT